MFSGNTHILFPVASGSVTLVQLRIKSALFFSTSLLSLSVGFFSVSAPRSSYFPPSHFLLYLHLPRSLLPLFVINSSQFVAGRKLTLFQSVSNVFYLFVLHNPHTYTHTRMWQKQSICVCVWYLNITSHKCFKCFK